MRRDDWTQLGSMKDMHSVSRSIMYTPMAKLMINAMTMEKK